jgi:hypothetical protein
MTAFEKTIVCLLPDWPRIDRRQRADVVARCSSLVRRQIRLAPIYVRIGFWCLFGVYRFIAVPLTAIRAGRMDRAAALTKFSALHLPMVFALERLLRSASLLFYFEQPEVLTALGEETIALRQVVFRAKRKSMYIPAPSISGTQGSTRSAQPESPDERSSERAS